MPLFRFSTLEGLILYQLIQSKARKDTSRSEPDLHILSLAYSVYLLLKAGQPCATKRGCICWRRLACMVRITNAYERRIRRDKSYIQV
jgi:hypothetical protein